MKTCSEAAAVSGPRQLLAAEAARLICEDGIRDFKHAKAKAARRLGVGGRRDLPSNAEVDAAVLDYLAMFAEETAACNHELRSAALPLMRLCADFQPRLVGDVLRGSCTVHTVIQLHLFAETPELVDLFLANRRIPFVDDEKRFRHPNGRFFEVPLCQLQAGEYPVELAVFGAIDLRWSPLSVADSRPMARADLAAVEALLAGSAAAAPR